MALGFVFIIPLERITDNNDNRFLCTQRERNERSVPRPYRRTPLTCPLNTGQGYVHRPYATF